MKPGNHMQGVLAPVITPFNNDLSPNPEKLLAHCKWLLAQNCNGLAIFGTNSEANSLSVDERIMLLDALVEGGIDPKVLLPGTGCCALSDSVRLTSHAVKLGCAGAMMLPPFYYKGVSDEGLFRNFAEIIQRVGDDRLRIYLYHIPPVAQVGITLNLIEMLLKAYPVATAGVKDSSGDWSNTEAMIKAFGKEFDVFSGNELTLLANMRAGGVGCITATGNINPAAIHDLWANWQTGEAEAMQASVTDFRMAVQQFPMIPSLKYTVAHFSGDTTWRNLRPPLVGLTAELESGLMAELEKRGFNMPALAA